MNQLEGIVTIRHTEHEVKGILTPEEAQFIQEQLRVKLEMVKISLVQHNEALFQSSLADAKKWTQQHFTKDTDVDNFIAELDRFANIKIRSQFPDISLSLKMLRDITKLRIETDKGMQPAETDVPAEKIESMKPTETVVPVEKIESTKPTETRVPTKAVPATQ
jgi:uncharacterized protein HemX